MGAHGKSTGRGEAWSQHSPAGHRVKAFSPGLALPRCQQFAARWTWRPVRNLRRLGCGVERARQTGTGTSLGPHCEGPLGCSLPLEDGLPLTDPRGMRALIRELLHPTPTHTENLPRGVFTQEALTFLLSWLPGLSQQRPGLVVGPHPVGSELSRS